MFAARMPAFVIDPGQYISFGASVMAGHAVEDNSEQSLPDMTCIGL
jgi:hypothetical protein